MNIQPTLDIHQEFHLAENTDSQGCCFCWKSTAVRPKEYWVSKNGDLERFKPRFKDHHNRIVANQRLAKLVKDKFVPDAINENLAFERLQEMVNHDFKNGDKITEEALISIVNAIYRIKREEKEEII